MFYYNSWKITSILFIITHKTRAANLRCYRNSVSDYVEVPLDQSSDLVNTSYIKLDQELDIVIHGYSADINHDSKIQDIITNLIETFGDTKSYCALDWKKEASAYIGSITNPIKKLFGLQILGIDYFAVSIIAGRVGTHLGKTFVEMKTRGIKMDDIYLIGHSEGAHLAGTAGRVVKSHGKLIGRITGLDPAKPPIEKALDKTCAKLVDVVHTSPHLYGTNKAIGHVDFWLNYGCSVQPGCKRWTFPLTFNNLCSHLRSLQVMADAVKFPYSLQGRKANSFDAFTQSSGVPGPDDINVIGFKINPNKTGTFYLCTNADSKYGKGPKGLNPAYCKCSFS